MNDIIKNRIHELLERRNAVDFSASEKIDRILKTKLVVVICLFLLLVAQVHHTVYVYAMATHEAYTPWYAWCYAIGIEGAILVFVVNGWRWQSMLFSLATILTNFLYGEYGTKEIPLAVNITISILLGGAIAGFSHLYYTKMKLIESIIEEVENGNTEDETKEKKPVDVCPKCGKHFYEKGQINGHISAYKRVEPEMWDGMQYKGKKHNDYLVFKNIDERVTSDNEVIPEKAPHLEKYIDSQKDLFNNVESGKEVKID